MDPIPSAPPLAACLIAAKPAQPPRSVRPLSEADLLEARSRQAQTTTILTLKDGSRYRLIRNPDGTERMEADASLGRLDTEAQALLLPSSFQPKSAALPRHCCHRFDGQRWSSFTPDSSASVKSIHTLRLMTFNVWFDPYMQEQRANELFRLVEQYKPDLIFFQEVTKPFLDLLKRAKSWTNGAIVSDLTGDSMTTYGVIAIINNPTLQPSQFVQTTFPSTMGRTLVEARFNLNGEAVSFGTVHLESLSNPIIRQSQLKICADVMQSAPHAFLLGDFNFDDKLNWDPLSIPLENDEMKKTLAGWTDTWEHVRPHDEGKTIDTTRNPMLRNGNERMRYDRVMYRSNAWRAQDIQIVGNEPFGEARELVPSDHFGLLADFELSR